MSKSAQTGWTNLQTELGTHDGGAGDLGTVRQLFLRQRAVQPKTTQLWG
jgi:hypothetical protein